MNYEETLKYISGVPKFSKTLGNADLLRLLDYLGNPQNSLKFIHIAGTNGKGSTAAMTAEILKTAGFKVGLYVSPFINIFNERIQINGEYIPDSSLSEIAGKVRSSIEKLQIEISEFAQITAMAFLYFFDQACDYVVLETGLGGRLDATNVITTPVVCVITKIGLDHTEYLGDTIEKITLEKCGIIKKGIPVVTCSNQNSEALSVIRNEAEKMGSSLVISKDYSEYPISLTGDYQQKNASVAISVCRLLNVPENAIKFGLSHTHFPARFEFLKENLIIDGAHNPDGALALISSLRALNRPVTIVTAMMEDKDVDSVCRLFSDFSEDIIVTQIDIPRCISAKSLAEKYNNCGRTCVIDTDCIHAVENALSGGGTVCVCGSLYLAAEIRKFYTR